MHCLSPGVNGMLKTFIVYMVEDEQRLSSTMRFENRNTRLFRTIEQAGLSTLHAFLKSRSSKAPGHGLIIDFLGLETATVLLDGFTRAGSTERLTHLISMP